MIVKIQIPLETNEPLPQALVYSEDRKVEFMVPVSDDILSLMGGEVKKYFHAEIDGGGMNISSEAVGQVW